jgi:DNA primase
MGLKQFIEEDFGIEGSGRWYRSVVHSSLVFDSENDLFFFNSRGIKGDTLTYLIEVRGMDKRAAQDVLKNVTAGMPVDSASNSLQVKLDKLVDLFHSAGKNDRQYWYDRKLTDSTIDRYRLGNFDEWNLIPIYDNGLFINFQCRRDKPSKSIKFWYKDKDFKPVLFNRDILPFVDKIYITEGMVDCLLLNQLGFPAVCPTNGSSSWNPGWIRYFTKIKEVTYIADHDSAGRHSAKSVANSLGTYKVKILEFLDKPDKYGALNFFVEGGDVDTFRGMINDSKYSFEIQ